MAVENENWKQKLIVNLRFFFCCWIFSTRVSLFSPNYFINSGSSWSASTDEIDTRITITTSIYEFCILHRARREKHSFFSLFTTFIALPRRFLDVLAVNFWLNEWDIMEPNRFGHLIWINHLQVFELCVYHEITNTSNIICYFSFNSFSFFSSARSTKDELLFHIHTSSSEISSLYSRIYKQIAPKTE